MYSWAIPHNLICQDGESRASSLDVSTVESLEARRLMVDGLMLEALNIASSRVDGWLMVQSFRVRGFVHLWLCWHLNLRFLIDGIVSEELN